MDFQHYAEGEYTKPGKRGRLNTIYLFDLD